MASSSQSLVKYNQRILFGLMRSLCVFVFCCRKMLRDARIQYVVSTAAVIVLVTCAMLVMTVMMRVPALPGGGSP